MIKQCLTNDKVLRKEKKRKKKIKNIWCLNIKKQTRKIGVAGGFI